MILYGGIDAVYFIFIFPLSFSFGEDIFVLEVRVWVKGGQSGESPASTWPQRVACVGGLLSRAE